MQNESQYEEDNLNELSLGELISIARNRANLSQEDLAKRAEMGTATVWRYENDRIIPRHDRLRKIADAVNHPVDWFYQ